MDPAGRINLHLFKAAEVPSVDGDNQSTTDFQLISGRFASGRLYGAPGARSGSVSITGVGPFKAHVPASGVCLSNAAT